MKLCHAAIDRWAISWQPIGSSSPAALAKQRAMTNTLAKYDETHAVLTELDAAQGSRWRSRPACRESAIRGCNELIAKLASGLSRESIGSHFVM